MTTTFNFFMISDLKNAKKQKGKPIPSFGITSDLKSILHYIRRYDLADDYAWNEVE